MFWRKRKPGISATRSRRVSKLEIDRLRAEGLSEEDARLAARRTFGKRGLR